jgi:CDP-diacylglycerol--glycerol-3-phosphate 3-phosphatidyltransferase
MKVVRSRKAQAPSRSPKTIKTILVGFIERPSRVLASWGVSPNALTLVGVFVTIMVPVSMLKERWIDAGCWLLMAGLFDVLDGNVARAGGRVSRFGAFWDSSLDRVSEAIVFAGFLLYYGQRQDMNGLMLAFAVAVFSFLVPYTRARAEGLGIDCEVGVLPRPGRVLLLAAGFFLVQPTFFLAVVGVLSLITVFQRVHRVWSRTRKS